MVNVAETLAIGTRHHQAGQLAEAERFYRQVLEAEPENAHALHLLGTLELQAGRFERAIELIGNAIRRDRSQPVFFANLAEAYRVGGDLAKAIAANQIALKLKPQYATAHANLGMIYGEQGDLSLAVECFHRALSANPDDPLTLVSLGEVLRQQEKPTAAEECYRPLASVNALV